MALIALLPLLVALPRIVGLLDANPLLRDGSLMLRVSRALVDGGFGKGAPYLDPNDGYTTQALGHLAAADWLHGVVPWWNPYSGVGLPLAGEFQPAAFFPLTLLQVLPQGMLWLHVALQIIAGWGAYALLRRLRLCEPAATAGGALFAFNGAIAWFNHAAALPVPFLPWMLAGIEDVYRGGSWRLLALALALSLLAGFPETAYIDGLLALTWAAARGVQAPEAARLAYVGRIILGGLVALGLSAPQLLAFLEFLPHAYLGGHGALLAGEALPPFAAIMSLIAPYAFGPIGAYVGDWPDLGVWSAVGGYVDLPLLGMALYGLLSRRKMALAWVLAAWVMLALAKTFGLAPVAADWNLVPGIAWIAFFRYAPASWILAITVLAAFGLDDLARGEIARGRFAGIAVAAVAAAMLGVSAVSIIRLEAPIHPAAGLRNWAIASLAWAAIVTLAVFILVCRGRSPRVARAVSALLIADAAIMALIPSLSDFASARVDTAAVKFLQANLRNQRFYTLGPIEANYGAYFGIASINASYLPIARRWSDWVTANLDRTAEAGGFGANYVPGAGQPTRVDELRRNLPAYAWVGVKYVVAPAGLAPFDGTVPGDGAPPRLVYRDRLMSIYELAGPGSYFDVVSGDCAVSAATSRIVAVAHCRSAGVLVRRELFFPGWSVTVNGVPAPIRSYMGLFQAIDLPAGEAGIVYAYAPPHIMWAWLAMALAVGVLAWPCVRLSWRERAGTASLSPRKDL